MVPENAVVHVILGMWMDDWGWSSARPCMCGAMTAFVCVISCNMSMWLADDRRRIRFASAPSPSLPILSASRVSACGRMTGLSLISRAGLVIMASPAGAMRMRMARDSTFWPGSGPRTCQAQAVVCCCPGILMWCRRIKAGGRMIPGGSAARVDGSMVAALST